MMNSVVARSMTVFRDSVRFNSATGDRFEPSYKMSIDENGVRELKVSGKIDTYAQIQSYKDSTDVNVILQRFANGDQSALSKIQGVYGDFTNMPTTLAQLSQRVLDAENLFNALPLATREQFNFSPSEFFASIGSDKFNAIFKDDSNQPSADMSATEPIIKSSQPVEANQGGDVDES